MSRNEMPLIVIVDSLDQAQTWLEQRYHDQRVILEEVISKGSGYGIEDVRRFRKSLQLTSVRQQRYVHYFSFGVNLTVDAQQAMLLLLEEIPVDHTVIFFTADLSRFLPTVLSRAVVVYADDNGLEISGLMLTEVHNYHDAIALAKDCTDREVARKLLGNCIIDLRREMYSSLRVVAALRFFNELYRSLMETTVAPRTIAEMALLTYVRLKRK